MYISSNFSQLAQGVSPNFLSIRHLPINVKQKLLKQLDDTIFKFVILCGEFFELSIKKFFNPNNEFIYFKNTNKIMQFLEEKVHNNDIILIKCSNSTKINKFAKTLLKQVSI